MYQLHVETEFAAISTAEHIVPCCHILFLLVSANSANFCQQFVTNIMQHGFPLLGNVLIKKFPRREILGKQLVAG
jgi:hypothetical protein